MYLLAYLAVVSSNYFAKKSEAVDRSRVLSGCKGIINLGAGCQRSSVSMSLCQVAKVNVDVVPVHPRGFTVDLNNVKLPYKTKEFDVALASHVLEHLDNWQGALNEWSRIADHVILVLPNPLSVGQMMNQDHKQHFSFSGMEEIKRKWPNVEIFT